MSRQQQAIYAQPAVKAFLAFSLGIFVASKTNFYSSQTFLASIIVVVVFLVLYFLIPKKRWNEIISSTVMLVFLIFLGMFWSQFRHEEVHSSITNYANQNDAHTIIGTVIEEPIEAKDHLRAVIECMSIGDSLKTSASGLALLHYTRNRFDRSDTFTSFRIGDVVRMTGKVRLPRDERNPGEFDYRKYLLAQDIVATISTYGASGVQVINHSSGEIWIQKIISNIRVTIRTALKKFFLPDQVAFISGLLIGDRSQINTDIINAFVNVGVIHVLAVSGLHVGMILLLIMGVFGRLPMGIRVSITIPMLVLYMLLTGSAPSVIRAVIMAVVFLIGMVIQRSNSPINSLSFAGFMLLVYQPMNLFLVGFQLSFGAVFSILILYPRIKLLINLIPTSVSELPVVKHVLQMFAITLAVQIGTAPLLFMYFGKFSIAAFAANIVVIPLIFVVLASSINVLLFSLIWERAAYLIAATTKATLAFIIDFTKTISSLPFASVEVSQPTMLECSIYITIVLYLFFATKKKIIFRTLLVIFSIGSFLALKNAYNIISPSKPLLRITMIDIGQGDAIHIELPSKRSLLIDAGPRSETFDSGEKIILPYFKRKGIHELAGLIITHPDNDHIGGAPSVLKSLDVHRIYCTKQWSISNEKKCIDSISSKDNIPVTILNLGDTVSIDPSVRMYVLHPSRQFIARDSTQGKLSANNSSIVLLLVYGKTKFIFTGDVAREGEMQISSSFGSLLHSDVLKVGHHGSTTCSSSQFLMKVKPSIALISCGQFNKFNHPRKEILTRLKLIGATIHRTDREGAIILESDGTEIKTIDWR